MVKQLNITLNDKEFKKAVKAKFLTGANSWREWILLCILQSEKENERRKE